jgi:predicted 3-demethylubiquinone-9 3-methyltransferase (glyoxalase superfamily)
MTGTFELAGQQFYAIDAGPQFKFTEAISFFVNCESQEEVDYFWEKLSAGRGKKPLRLAQRQIRRLVANRPHGFRRDVARQRCRESGEGHASDAAKG